MFFFSYFSFLIRNQFKTLFRSHPQFFWYSEKCHHISRHCDGHWIHMIYIFCMRKTGWNMYINIYSVLFSPCTLRLTVIVCRRSCSILIWGILMPIYPCNFWCVDAPFLIIIYIYDIYVHIHYIYTEKFDVVSVCNKFGVIESGTRRANCYLYKIER